MKNLKIALCALCCFVFVSACTPTVDDIFGEEDPVLNNVALQSLQTREYDCTKEQAFSAVTAVFQDYGYSIEQVEYNAGLISAKTQSLASIEGSIYQYAKTAYDKATATINNVTKEKVRIRISIVKHVEASLMGTSGEKEAIRTDPKIYQDMFTKVQKNIFLQQNL